MLSAGWHRVPSKEGATMQPKPFIHVGDAASSVTQNAILAKLNETLAALEQQLDSLRDLRTMLSAIRAPRVDSATRK
jgi:hypothetical protein